MIALSRRLDLVRQKKLKRSAFDAPTTPASVGAESGLHRSACGMGAQGACGDAVKPMAYLFARSERG